MQVLSLIVVKQPCCGILHLLRLNKNSVKSLIPISYLRALGLGPAKMLINVELIATIIDLGNIHS